MTTKRMTFDQVKNHSQVYGFFKMKGANIYITSNDVVHELSSAEPLFKIDSFASEDLRKTITKWRDNGGRVDGVYITLD